MASTKKTTSKRKLDHKRGLCGEPDIHDNVARSFIEKSPACCQCCGSKMDIKECERSADISELNYRLVCPICPQSAQKQKPGEDVACKECGCTEWRLKIYQVNLLGTHFDCVCIKCGKCLDASKLGRDSYSIVRQVTRFITVRGKPLAELTSEDVPCGMDPYDVAADVRYNNYR